MSYYHQLPGLLQRLSHQRQTIVMLLGACSLLMTGACANVGGGTLPYANGQYDLPIGTVTAGDINSLASGDPIW